MSLSTGQSLGPYTIVAPLGAGGMGEVYRARDARLDRDVAIKVAAPSRRGERRTRWRASSRKRGRSRRCRIRTSSTIYDVGTARRASPTSVMELLEGETLRERLAGGPLPVAQGRRDTPLRSRAGWPRRTKAASSTAT